MSYLDAFVCSAVYLCLAAAALADPVPILRQPIANAQQPQMAVAPDGALHLVFGTRDDSDFKGPGRRPPTDGSLYHVSTRDFQTFSSPQKLADLPKIALGMRRGPRVAATGKALIVTAQSHEDGNVHLWLSTDSGASWKEQPHLNGTAGSAREGLHALATNGDVVAAVWLDDRHGGAEVWCRVSKNGGLDWEAERLVYRSPDGHVCQCCIPSIAVSREGHIAVMWRNALGGSRDLYRAVSMDGGRTFGPAAKLGSGTWPLNACPMDGGAIAWNLDGELEAVWRREGNLYLTRPGAPETRFATDAAQPLLVPAHQGWNLLWEAQGNLVFQRALNEPAPFAEKARAASFLALPAGRLATAWESNLKGATELLFEAF